MILVRWAYYRASQGKSVFGLSAEAFKALALRLCSRASRPEEVGFEQTGLWQRRRCGHCLGDQAGIGEGGKGISFASLRRF